MQDVVAEPIRSSLIPFYDEVKRKALEAGAIGCNIAGSGPSIFAFSNLEEIANSIKEAMSSVYKESSIKAQTFISKIGRSGVRII